MQELHSQRTEVKPMRQEINNREYRKEVIKNLLRKLHAGQTADEVR